MRALTKTGIAIYGMAATINLLAGFADMPILDYTSKPLLLSSLILIYLSKVKPWSIFSGYFIAGLTSSLVGDILLMLMPSAGEQFFIYGLLAFLCAHISYILAFSTYARQKGAHYLKRAPWVLVPFLLFFTGITWWWKDELGALKLPVIVYSAVITSMGIAASNLRLVLTEAKYRGLVAGALLFILSDTLIAIGKFKMVLPGGHIWVMLTYISAQALIVWAALEMGSHAGTIVNAPDRDKQS